MLTLSNLQDRVNKKIHNNKAKLGGDAELTKILDESNSRLQIKADLPSSKRLSAPFMVFREIYEYSLPSDISYDKTTQLKFERDGKEGSEFEKTNAKYLFKNRNPYFSRVLGNSGIPVNKNEQLTNSVNVIAVQWEDGNPYLKVKLFEGGMSSMLQNCNDLTDNGTWAISGDATNLRLDNIRYKEGPASISFDSGGVSTDIIITNPDFEAVDLSDYENKSKLFFWVNIPATTPESITMKWGADSSNYLSRTVTTKQSGLAFTTGWNLVGFDWEGATETGTVDNENIDYAQITITNTVAVAQTGYRVDKIAAFIGEECSLDYYSKYLVKSNAGVRKEKFEDGDDTTILNEKESILLIDEATQNALENLREVQEAGVRRDIKNENIQTFQDDQPGEEEPTSVTYYNT